MDGQVPLRAREGRSAVASRLLRKPRSPSDVAARVVELLDRRGRTAPNLVRTLRKFLSHGLPPAGVWTWLPPTRAGALGAQDAVCGRSRRTGVRYASFGALNRFFLHHGAVR